MQAYIQKVFDDHGNIIIICFFKAQAKLLLEQQSFEVDMSFKWIRQKEINEIVIAGLLQSHGKSKLLLSYLKLDPNMFKSLYLRSNLHKHGLHRRVSPCLLLLVSNNFSPPSKGYNMAAYP